MKTENLQKPIIIINRQTGRIEKIIKTKPDYEITYKQICNLPSMKKAIETWCDYTETTKSELLKDFNLVELINTFSVDYHAQFNKPRKKDVK